MLGTAYIAEGYEGSDRRENGLVVAQDALSEKPSAHRRRNNLHRLKEVCSDSMNTLTDELSSTTFCVAKNVCELCHGNHHTVEPSGVRGGRSMRFCDVRPAPPARSGALYGFGGVLEVLRGAGGAPRGAADLAADAAGHPAQKAGAVLGLRRLGVAPVPGVPSRLVVAGAGRLAGLFPLSQ